MNSDMIGDITGLAVVVLALLIPIITILCKHQIRMAALLRENPNQFGTLNADQVGRDMQELRSLVAQQAMSIDSLANAQRDLAREIRSNRDLSERISSS